MLLTLGICSGSAGSICDGAIFKYIYENPPGNGEMLFLSPICQAVLLVVFLFAVTPLRYIRWHYELRPDFLELKYGIIWRKHIVVPFIRAQNTDTKQGPILRAFGLASVTVSTAAGSMEIPGLLTEEADSVRDRAAEFARLAREDV